MKNCLSGKVSFVLLLFFYSAFSLYAENDNSVFVISSIDTNIKGITRHFAIIRNGEFKIGEKITGKDKLEKFIADKTQLLSNQRVLNKAEINYVIEEMNQDGEYPVKLFIFTEDTWNIIALPYPKYDSNTGFELILKARDYNFLGTMNPLRLDIGYKHDENNKNSLLIELESDTPFTLFGFDWNVKFNNYFRYRPDVSEKYYYKNLTGLSVQVPFKTTTFVFGLDESFFVNDENADRYKDKYGDFQSGLYMVSQPYASWKIPTGLDVFNYGELTYKPELSASFSHEFPSWPLAEFRRGPKLSFNHSLGFDKVNWIGNYRSGLDVYFSNSYSYDFYRLTNDQEPLSYYYGIIGKGYFIINDYFGISANLQFRHWFYHDPEYYDEGGDALRGILDKSIHTNFMLSLNLDFPVRILQFQPSQWFHTSKLRLFDFDMHLSPIIDMALYNDPESNISFSFKNMLVSGGLEVIVFPAFMRSLYVRISVAWNFIDQINNPGDYYLNPILPIVPHLPTGDNREIFVGIGHHY